MDGVIESALDKIRDGEGTAVTLLSDEEAQALVHFVKEKEGQPALQEADHVLCRQIRSVLQERDARLRQPKQAPVFQRTNLTLRAAIDLFLAQDYAAVLKRDVVMLRDTRAKLDAMVATGDSSPNHVRLSTLIGECLEAYGVWQARQPSGAEAPAAAPLTAPPSLADSRPAKKIDGNILESAGPREAITEIEGVPIAANVRTLLHEGAMELPCELTDEYLVDVRGGSLVVRGGLFGFAVADGDITVHGSVQGGWLYSRTGSIRADHILAGAVLIAPMGGVAGGNVENPKLIFCGQDLASDQGLRGGTCFARNVAVGEGIRNTRIHLRGNLSAKTIAVDPQDDPPLIQFRLAQTCQDFGRPIPDSQASSLRNFGRLWYRWRISRALAAYLEADLLAVQRFRLFALLAGGVEPGVIAPIREAQAEHAILTLLVELGEGLKELFVLGENIGKEMEVAFAGAGVEESTASLAIAAKEIKSLCRGFVRDKDFIEAPCRHIASFVKKLKDNARQLAGADKLFYDFDFRMDEWRAQARQSAEIAEKHNEGMAKRLGPTLWEVTDCANLTTILTGMTKAAEEAGKLPRLMQAREMAAIREHAAQHVGNRAIWHRNAEALRKELDHVLKTLGESLCLNVSDGEEARVRAENFGQGLRFQTLASMKKVSGPQGSMALVIHAGMDSPTLIRMRNLRLYSESDEA